MTVSVSVVEMILPSASLVTEIERDNWVATQPVSRDRTSERIKVLGFMWCSFSHQSTKTAATQLKKAAIVKKIVQFHNTI